MSAQSLPQFGHGNNHRQSRVGTPVVDGKYFRQTKSGDEIGVFSLMANQPTEVSLMVNLGVSAMTPSEARQLAQLQLYHADMAELEANA